ncbi:hypothetical protein PSTG_04714 [Puccinia striiformis f. sp. tritici PST-78]|uniref:Uncharacterized protein n=1 Tax=Puccinia striiformis f. sp. tritici PST-78 TaxID=1165861 RepID=A0A0L0VT63_9BASI|nr:hypothetical protein PSTG_04714 [Puccinia striiformis f. sp. tritici PST-78]
MERIQEELEEQLRSDNSNHGDRRVAYESQERCGQDAEDKGKGKRKSPVQRPPRPSLSTQESVSSDFPNSFDLDDWSNPSNKEFLLQNINNDYTRDAPLIIEDKLKDLFSHFLSELSGTIDNIPNTLLETSIQNFSEIMRDSMSDIVKDNIIPSMLDNILDYMGQIVRDVKGPSYKLEVESVFENKLSAAVTELQDVLYETDTNNLGNYEAIKEDFLNIKKEIADNFSLVKNDMDDIIKKEKENSLAINRKLNDLAAILHNMNFKLSSIIEPIEEPDKDNPPHMEPKQMTKEHITKEESQEHKIPQQCAPIRNLEPTNQITEDWEVTFPKLNHGPIDLDLRRELWRGIPKTTEWETTLC